MALLPDHAKQKSDTRTTQPLQPKQTEGTATLLQALLERVLEVAGESLRFKALKGSWFRVSGLHC